jgi:nitrite reductase/ring-hydroxylating ferredoxin subunit
MLLRRLGGVFTLAAVGIDGPADALAVVVGASGAAAGSERRYPIPAVDGVTIDRANQVIIVRYQNALFAFNLACPHENTALKWLPKDHRFQCPKHQSQYQPSGVFTTGRATRNMDRLGVRLEGGMLAVDLNKFYQSDKDPSGWAAATVAL